MTPRIARSLAFITVIWAALTGAGIVVVALHLGIVFLIGGLGVLILSEIVWLEWLGRELAKCSSSESS